MDQYNTKRKALERLMEMYDEYCINTVPMKTPQQKQRTKQQLPPSTSQAQLTPSREATSRDVLNRREQTNEDLRSEETSLKEGMDRNSSTLTSDDTLGMNTMSSTIPITTRHQCFQILLLTLSQGRISTLSSVVQPMPMTATRTIAITREESRCDALETVRQLIGSVSHIQQIYLCQPLLQLHMKHVQMAMMI